MTRTSRERLDCEVAIIGYGPTGMAAAALLGQLGRSVVVVERYEQLFNLPRAACFDDEIMRTLQKLGLAEPAMPGVLVQPDYEWVSASGETLINLAYDDPAPGGWAALYSMYQPHLESVLDAECRSLASVDVRQGFTVERMEQESEVLLSAVGSDGAHLEIYAQYVIAADGGNSFARDALGIDLFDYGFRENWLVCDFEKLRKVSLPTFRQVCDPRQPRSIIQIGPQHHRFSFMLDPDVRAHDATAERRIWERVSDFLGPEDAELVRAANYVFTSQVAERWRERRIVLAGDAAHQMPPFLGQGMCSGIRDSHNLAWKLDRVLSRAADPRILDSYQIEREPHVRFITEKAIELGRIQTLRDPEAAEQRDEQLLAKRRARSAPEKVRLPPLGDGFLSQRGRGKGAGEFCLQSRVRSEYGEGLFDDVVGMGPVIIARGREIIDGLSSDMLALWERRGGSVAVFDEKDLGRRSASVVRVQDVTGVYGAWFTDRCCDAAVVRPDWYVYGTAKTSTDLAEMVQEWDTTLSAGSRISSAALSKGGTMSSRRA